VFKYRLVSLISEFAASAALAGRRSSLRLSAKLLAAALLGVAVLAGAHSAPSTGKRAGNGSAQTTKPGGVSKQVFGAASTAKRLARGRYLVEGPMACFACHSEVNADLEPLPGMKGAGAVFLGKLPFRLVAPNITPDKDTGIGAWTDGQIAQAIRNGIAPDGRRLFPVMPYLSYRVLSDEDLKSLIVYLRSIPPIRHALAPSEIPPAALAGLPPLVPVGGPEAPPDLSNPIKRGQYMATLADCRTCHTPIGPEGRFIDRMEFAGGHIFEGPWGRAASANITPDPSGISYYTRAMIFQVMRDRRLGARPLSPIMPSVYFRKMTDQDIGAIFAYLKTVKPVKHRVDNIDRPTHCPLDGQMHGLGDLN